MNLRRLLLVTATFAGVSSAYASITVTNYWSLGEDGQLLATDSVAAKNFQVSVGTVVVDSTLFSGIGGSTRSLSFTGGFEYMSGNSITVPTNNWMVEVSVYVSSLPGADKSILTLGSTSSRGSQLGIHNNNFFFGQQNVTYGFNAAAVTAGAWQNLAWVNDAGTNKFYLNGSLIGSDTTDYGFVNNNGFLTLGTQAGGGKDFTGNLDNLRFSTFTAGNFNAATDLMVTAVPEPSTYGLPGVGAFAFAFAFVRRRRKSAR